MDEFRNNHHPTYWTFFKANLKGCTIKVGMQLDSYYPIVTPSLTKYKNISSMLLVK